MTSDQKTQALQQLQQSLSERQLYAAQAFADLLPEAARKLRTALEEAEGKHLADIAFRILEEGGVLRGQRSEAPSTLPQNQINIQQLNVMDSERLSSMLGGAKHVTEIDYHVEEAELVGPQAERPSIPAPTEEKKTPKKKAPKRKTRRAKPVAQEEDDDDWQRQILSQKR